MSNVLEIASYYVNKQGFSLIPLLGKIPDASVLPTEPNEKGELKATWKPYQSRKPTPEELQKWFGNGVKRNIGIVTGAISGIAVVDLDTAEAVQIAKDLELQDTPAVRTGKGYHLYYKYRDGVRNFQKRDDLPGIDLRGDGGYVAAPPSIHASGTQYAWVEGKKLGRLPLAEFPEIILAKHGSDSQKTSVKELYKGAPEGGRNDTLARLTGSWVRDGLSLEDCIENAYVWNARNNPPLREREIERTVESIWNTHYRKTENTKPDDNTSIVRPSDLFPEIDELYEKGFQRGVGTGWAKLDEYYTVRLGEVTVITGIPSHGKTNWLTNLMVNIADREAWKFAVFSPENFPMQRFCAHIAQIWSGMPFSTGYNTRIPRENLDGIKFWIDENFVFIVPKSDEMQIDNLIHKAMICVIKHGAKGVVFDPWNEIDHARPSGLSETEYISKCLSKIRYFAREYKVHVWLVAHPTKLQRGKDGNYPVPTPYDISGSSHFRNKADNCLTVWRDLQNTHLPTKIYTQKIRFHEVGKIGECDLNYNPALQSYY